MHCRRLLPYLWPLTNFKNFIRFQNVLNQNTNLNFGPYLASCISGKLPSHLPSYLSIELDLQQTHSSAVRHNANKHSCFFNVLIVVADPGFPGGSANPGGEAIYYLTNLSWKLNENEEILARRGARDAPPFFVKGLVLSHRQIKF